MKIGFFGGSFNPPTIAHLNLAKQAVKEYNYPVIKVEVGHEMPNLPVLLG
jgi:nicotinic acid mononucleotide adenylyltransferase